MRLFGREPPHFVISVLFRGLMVGRRFREAGVSYQCHLSGGKHTASRETSKIIPLEKIVTVLPQDTFGISKVFSDHTVETTFQKLGDFSTKVEVSHYYSTPTMNAKLLALVAKGKVARETQATLTAAKTAIEATRYSAPALWCWRR